MPDYSKLPLEIFLLECLILGNIYFLFRQICHKIYFIKLLNSVVRSVSWSESSNIFVTVSDAPNSRENGAISIYSVPSRDSFSINKDDPIALKASLEIKVDGINKATSVGWTLANRHIVAGFDSGTIIKYDPETGQEVDRSNDHSERVNRINFNKDKTLMVTASKDCSTKLFDPETLQVIRTYKTDRPVNAAVISPLHPHVLLGGGQDAMQVTVTAASSGKFETRFFHMVYGEEFGRLKGHFGPINALAIHPSGKSFTSGAEDGFLRIHHFDSAYINMSDELPADLKM